METVDRWQLWLLAAKERAAQLEQPRRVLRSSAHRQSLPAAAPAWYEGKPVMSSSFNRVSAKPMLMYSHGGRSVENRGRQRTPRVINRAPDAVSESPAPAPKRKFVKRGIVAEAGKSASVQKISRKMTTDSEYDET